MNFSEIFEKFKSNTATEEEKRYVADEIEKNMVISDYLSHQTDDIFNPHTTRGVEGNAVGEITTLHRIIKRKNIMIVATAVIIVFVIIVLYQFAIIPLGSMFFYNPSSYITIYDENANANVEINQLTKAASVFLELHSPTIRSGSIESIRTGLASYEVEFYTMNRFSGEQEKIITKFQYGKIDRQFIEWIDLLNVRVPSDVFKEQSHRHEKNDEEWIKMMEKLEALPSGVSIETSVTFGKALKPAELIQIIHQYEGIEIYWAGVENGQTGTPLSSGFDPTNVIQNDASDAQRIQEHFLNLLQIEINHEDFLNVLNRGYINLSFYENVKEYVEENGIKIYGFVLKGSAEDIKKLSEKENIIWMQLENAMFELN
ncbi:MAG: anti sigma factor C-terminal domain-containing protein [Eubacteriales bacterium]